METEVLIPMKAFQTNETDLPIVAELCETPLTLLHDSPSAAFKTCNAYLLLCPELRGSSNDLSLIALTLGTSLAILYRR